MRRFRIYFNIGWCSAEVHAANREEAVRKVWVALDEVGHGAIAGLRLGSYTISAEDAHELEADEPSGRCDPTASASCLPSHFPNLSTEAGP